MTASLQLRLKKGADGKIASFALHRADGTVTVMRNVHTFFPIHDLTHYALETTLRFRRGFYGLVCEGWNFEDFGTPWPRGRLPADLDPAEQLAGMFDLERATGHLMTVEDVNDQLRLYSQAHPAVAPLALTQGELDTIRQRISTYAAQWRSLANGATLALDYTPGTDTVG